MRERIVAACTSAEIVSSSTLRVIALIDDEDYSADEVSRAIQLDPVLAAHVLAISNSALFRPAVPIVSVHAAVSRLGAKQILEAVVSSIGASIPDDLEGYDVHYGGMWRHALAVSLATRELADRLSLSGFEAAATAGLLTDLGKLVLDPFTLEVGSAVIDRARELGIPYDQAEREVLGIDHAEVGELLLREWALPHSIVSVVRWHHDPDSCPEEHRDVADLVHLAECICSMAGFGLGTDGVHYSPSPASAARLGYTNPIAEGVLAAILSRVEELVELEKAA